MDCTNINLSKGSKGEKVKELQTLLKNKGYYTEKIDGEFGEYTLTALKKYQKANGLAVDGIFGPVTCKKLNTSNNGSNGVYTSSPHWLSAGCNKLGQCTGYFCAPHSFRQILAKWNIDNYSEYTLAGYMGTTSAGTSHYGIETGIATVAKKEGIKLKVEWKNFSDLGNNKAERFKALAKRFSDPNKGVILHVLYQNKYGHYEVLRTINTRNNTTVVLNSLGSKCSSPAYCGRLENRSYNTWVSYLAGISQKSICIISKS